MAGKTQFDDEPIVDINITPLVDIVLVLLIIFMVTAQFIVGRGINLELPNAKSGEALKQNTLSISILKNSIYMLDGKSMTISELNAYIDKKFRNKNTISILISADKSVSYQSLVELMDALRLLGISNFALQTNSTTSKL